jgi:hypothetical protein
MKLNNIDISSLSDDDLKRMCIKYQIIQHSELQTITRERLLKETKTYLLFKIQTYKQRKRSMSDPNIRMISSSPSSPSTPSSPSSPSGIPTRDRRMSAPNAVNIVKDQGGPPKSMEHYTRDRRMSHPITTNEVQVAKENHQVRKQLLQQKQEVTQSINMEEYDKIGMYPPVPRLVAIGDLHGDLKVTLQVLRLAKVIPRDIYPNNVDRISWCGGSTWIVQLGDQIDRCRPDEWKKNCVEDFDDIVEDEGNNMRIIKIFQSLDAEARKCGGRVLGILGNHELMNVDKDYRYVSPQEFLEFVPASQRGPKYTEDGYPMGYYHRLKSFERGGNIAKHYAYQKKSIIQVGKFIFVHGGMGHALSSKYTIHELNTLVRKWLLKETDPGEESAFDEVFRSDDDISPFWCRLYSEGDNEDENTEQGFNQLMEILNRRNRVIQPIEGMVVAHTPQFMNDRFLNSRYNNRLWRIDVGMSRAFGKHDNCGENKYRQIQILVIKNNSEFEVLKSPYDGRIMCEGMGEAIDIHGQQMPF